MNNDYSSPTPEPVDNNATTVQILKEKNDFVFVDKSNDLEVIFPEKTSVIDKKEKKANKL
ncbi:hypothetical protein ACWOC1_06725 [Enterococcus quebecensis]|uniref:Uncharacterized protein n=1 Tax=Enterococcus quebecensis TaxID=903983 RepID=A0A1E5GRV9_9ENTE|nr:hypothetical protein [Enterococcus quebecensis]OEG15454.1 hypothetical protein BCR23_08270 [Enterococcus quebecensis]OJG74048.1 hypothetical protein RV12_GL000396 [Enterococcus quebecensis]